MQEINVLKEKDLPYFERLEKEGKAVILRFRSLDDIAAFDLASYLGGEEKTLTLEEVQAWLGEEKEVIRELGDRYERFREHIRKDEQLTEKYRMVGGNLLSEREIVALVVMIGEGCTKEELSGILDPLLTVEERSRKIWETAAKYREKEEKEEAGQD